jgi:DNA-binding response OmpR family regulator
MKILLLESDAVDAERIKMALLRAGHDVHSVGSGRLVIRHLETARVDLLVLDCAGPFGGRDTRLGPRPRRRTRTGAVFDRTLQGR